MVRVRYTAWDGTQQIRLTADQLFELIFEPTEIGLLGKGRSTGFRVELTVKGPEEIARAAQQFGQEDDITVLSLRRPGMVSKPLNLSEPSAWSTAPA